MPVYNYNDRRDLGNYRLILILPIISKVFEKEILDQLYHYLKGNSFPSEFQSGGAFHLGEKPGNFGGSKSGISDW